MTSGYIAPFERVKQVHQKHVHPSATTWKEVERNVAQMDRATLERN